LHDLFISIEGMTPGEFRHGGADLEINYSFAESPFGNILVASTSKGICYMAFVDEPTEATALADLRTHFPNARLRQMTDLIQQNALYIFTQRLEPFATDQTAPERD
jgi:AraC family transcriptional regulator of adaptative response/methylated-DNA-[protein]-cysteine methyltransferase